MAAFVAFVLAYLVSLAAALVKAWVVMILAPLALPGFAPTYWQSFGIVVLVSILVTTTPKLSKK